ncbi:Thymidylate kinase [Lecanora helva]
MPEKTRGALIVIEGLDRAGKSTQHERICQNLEKQGHSVKRVRFPDRTTPIGKSIDAYLKGESQQEDHVIHLLFSANRWEAAASIRAAIEAGTTVVIDRYYYSGIVYSAAKGNPSLSLEWARYPEIGLPLPDLCVFLDITPEDAAKRGGFGSEKYETSAMQKRVRELFYELSKTSDGRDMRIVNGGRSIEEVGEEIARLVEEVLKSAQMQEDLGRIPPWDHSVPGHG